MKRGQLLTIVYALSIIINACGGEEPDTAIVSIKNDFNNPQIEKKPPWTICHAWYNGTFFEKIEIGQTSEEQEVTAGLEYVYMIAAWDDPACAIENSLPVASKQESETVPEQTLTIAINVPNHQGPCPPEGVQPISEVLYNKILELWPEYNFKPYVQRTENPQCVE